jgi:hypothetical protein
MWKVAAFIILAGCSPVCLTAQSNETQGCTARPEFAPVIVKNPDSKVTFKCDQAAPLDLIRAIGRQTRIPIGIVLGRDPSILSKPKQPYDLENVGARLALQKAIQDTGYTLEEKNHVIVLVAGDLTARQQDVLTYPYSDFGPVSNGTMVELGAVLTGWMLAEIDYVKGYGGSIGGSLNDERLTLKVPPVVTTEEIADSIVSLGSKGIWILRTDPFPASGAPTDEVVIEPYQHYSNRPNVDH